MKTTKNIWVFLLCLALVVSLTAVCGVDAKELKYPTKPIKIIVPFAAGSGNDIIARAVARYIKLDQPVVVENHPGGSGVIGAMKVYHAAPDGYTLACVNPEAQLAMNLSGAMPTPVWKDMEMVASLVYDSNTVTVPKDSKFKTMNEVIEYAKKNPDKLTWGAAGSRGYIEQVSVELWQKAGGLKIKYIPFDTGVTARTAAMGGHLDIFFGGVADVVPVVKSGEMRALASTSGKRSKFLPDVPTMKELGVDIQTGLHRAFTAPPKTSKVIITKLENVLRQLYNIPAFVKVIENDLSFEARFLGSEDLKKLLQDRYPIHLELVKGLSVQK